MAGEEESDGIKLFLQPLGGQPWLDLGQPQCTARGTVAERELERATFPGLVCALRLGQNGIDGGKHARAVALKRLECAGGRETFQHALVDRARIDAGREVGEVGERSIVTRRDDRLDRLSADAFEGGERVVNGVAVDLEGNARAI